MISSAESFCNSYSQGADCLLVKARHVTPLEMKSLEYARRTEVIHSFMQYLAPRLVPLRLIFIVRCHCKDFRFAQAFGQYDSVYCRFQIPDVRVGDRLEGGLCQIYFFCIVDTSTSHQDDRSGDYAPQPVPEYFKAFQGTRNCLARESESLFHIFSSLFSNKRSRMHERS